MNASIDELPSNVERMLAEVSEKLMKENDGCCFKVEANDQGEEYDSYKPSYDNNELDEFINFDMLGEGDGLESFGHLITADNHDLTGDRKVLKVLLDPGLYTLFFYFYKIVPMLFQRKNLLIRY